MYHIFYFYGMKCFINTITIGSKNIGHFKNYFTFNKFNINSISIAAFASGYFNPVFSGIAKLLNWSLSKSIIFPQEMQCRWWWFFIFGSKRLGPLKDSTRSMMPISARVCSVLFTVSKDIFGNLLRIVWKRLSAEGCFFDCISSLYMAIRWGVILRLCALHRPKKWAIASGMDCFCIWFLNRNESYLSSNF